jgi:hypothetical protein
MYWTSNKRALNDKVRGRNLGEPGRTLPCQGTKNRRKRVSDIPWSQYFSSPLFSVGVVRYPVEDYLLWKSGCLSLLLASSRRDEKIVDVLLYPLAHARAWKWVSQPGAGDLVERADLGRANRTSDEQTE